MTFRTSERFNSWGSQREITVEGYTVCIMQDVRTEVKSALTLAKVSVIFKERTESFFFKSVGRVSWIMSRLRGACFLTLEVLHNAPQTVSMGSDQDPLSLLNLRYNLFVPERKSPGNGVLKAFTAGELVLCQISITPILSQKKLVSKAGRISATQTNSVGWIPVIMSVKNRGSYYRLSPCLCFDRRDAPHP